MQYQNPMNPRRHSRVTLEFSTLCLFTAPVSAEIPRGEGAMGFKRIIQRVHRRGDMVDKGVGQGNRVARDHALEAFQFWVRSQGIGTPTSSVPIREMQPSRGLLQAATSAEVALRF